MKLALPLLILLFCLTGYSQTINVTDHGAVCNGTTDDTTAIRAVIASAPGGSTIYAPRCLVGLAANSTDTEVLFFQKGVHVEGRLIFKTTTPNTADWIRFRPMTTIDQESFVLHNLRLEPQNLVEANYITALPTVQNGNWGCAAANGHPAGLDTCPGRNAVVLDNTGSPYYVDPNRIEVSNTLIFPSGGRGIVGIGTGNSNGALQSSTIGPNNLIYNGIFLNGGSDNVRIIGNSIIGRNPCVEADMVPGASALEIADMTCTGDGGVWIKSGQGAHIHDTIIEKYANYGSTLGHNGHLLDINGDGMAGLYSVRIEGVVLNSYADSTLGGIRVNNASRVIIGRNIYNTPAGTNAITLTANAVKTTYDFDHADQRGDGGDVNDLSASSSVPALVFKTPTPATVQPGSFNITGVVIAGSVATNIRYLDPAHPAILESDETLRYDGSITQTLPLVGEVPNGRPLCFLSEGTPGNVITVNAASGNYIQDGPNLLTSIQVSNSSPRVCLKASYVSGSVSWFITHK